MTTRTEGASRHRSRERFRFFTSLRSEMILSLAVLGAAALALAALNVLVLQALVASRHGGLYLVLLILADVVLFVAFGAYKVQRLLIEPIESIIATTEAIASGDLTRRVPPGSTIEFARLSRSINRMTSRLFEEQAQRAHLEKVASVGRLAAGVAHEIGHPLGAISGCVQQLRASVCGDADAAGALAGIERERARIAGIMRGMLDYARPRPRATEHVNLNDAAHRVLAMLGDQGALRGVQVRLDLADELPALVADPHELEQVLVNLLLNAVGAVSGDGAITIVSRRVAFASAAEGSDRRGEDIDALAPDRVPDARVQAWLRAAGDSRDVVTLVVADSGPGVPWSESERVFDPFVTTKEPGQGTGLGLAIVERIVEALGGTVWVRQAREGGAAFVMYFPVPPGETDPGQEPAQRVDVAV